MPAAFGRSRILIPATVGLTVGGLFLALWGVVNDRTRTAVRLRTSLTAEQIGDRLKDEVGFCFRLMRGLQAEWNDGLIESKAVFLQQAKAIRTYCPSIVAIEILDEGGTLMWREPDMRGPIWLTPMLTTRPGPHPRPEAGQTADDDPILLSSSLIFANDTTGVVAFLPLHGAGASRLRVSLIVTGLIKDSLLGSGHGDFAYVVYDSGRRIFPADEDARLSTERFSYLHPIVLANRT